MHLVQNALNVDSSSLTVSFKVLGVNSKQATSDPSMLEIKAQAHFRRYIILLQDEYLKLELQTKFSTF